jgi:hypothetical protein
MTLLQSAQTGRRINVLKNHLIQLFQQNNMIVNEQSWCTAMSHMSHETPHTLNSTPYFRRWRPIWYISTYCTQLYKKQRHVTMVIIFLPFKLNIIQFYIYIYIYISYFLESNPHPNLIRTSFPDFLKGKKLVSRF